MKGLKRQRGRFIRGQGGYLLPITILAITFGAMVIIPLLSYNTVVFRVDRVSRARELAIYAAEAGVKRVLADLIRGADAIPTTYVAEEPHQEGEPYQTFYITTSYTIPQVTLNDYTPTITIETPSSSPPASQQYIDPGLANPDLADMPAGTGYLMRLYNVKEGILQVNWAYEPAGVSRIGIWKGIPVDPDTGEPYPPGRIDEWPVGPPILDTGPTPPSATYNQTEPISVEAGVYTIVFDNTTGDFPKTTKPFAPSGNADDTWIWVTAYKDYLITSEAGGVKVRYFVRQIPGYSEPPSGDWSTTNPSFIANGVYVRSWEIASPELTPTPTP
jgi:hypothetical protein